MSALFAAGHAGALPLLVLIPFAIADLALIKESTLPESVAIVSGRQELHPAHNER
jgi:hypothetical protein